MLVGHAVALPTTGAASLIGSNNFTSTATGVTGTSAYIVWGQATGVYNFNTGNSTATAGSSTIKVWGAPLIGGRTVYFKACDTTGCGSELTAAIPQVTAIPVPTFGNGLRELTSSHFAITNISSALTGAYVASGTPILLLWGIMYLCIFVGFWLRTRSGRLGFVMVMLIVPFIAYETAGLYLGLPSVASGFIMVLAALLAGMVYSLAHG